jgi:hypothetical protein
MLMMMFFDGVHVKDFGFADLCMCIVTKEGIRGTMLTDEVFKRVG